MIEPVRFRYVGEQLAERVADITAGPERLAEMSSVSNASARNDETQEKSSAAPMSFV